MGKYREIRKRRKRNRNIAVGVLFIAALSAGGYLYSRASSNSLQPVGETEKETTADLTDKILSAARVGQTDLTGLTVKEAEETLMERYQWELIVSDGKDSVLLDNLIEPQLQAIKKQLEETPPDQAQQYEIDYEALREPFISQPATLAERCDKGAVNSEQES